ncbi:hypothetical protein LIER_12084 [Lithospermum erythrorhizon]|uniref:Uncharacterized protein n=1 Tax=Lithospermum erythrorhizon TaxID=34254 RepID=A0AAV3PRW1_LITER
MTSTNFETPTIVASNVNAQNLSMVDSTVVNTTNVVGHNSGETGNPPGFGSGPDVLPHQISIKLVKA